MRAAKVHVLEDLGEVLHVVGDELVVVFDAADFAAVVGGQVAAQDLFKLLGEFEERSADRLVAVLLSLLQLLLELLPLEFRQAHPSREAFRVDHDPLDAAGDFK